MTSVKQSQANGLRTMLALVLDRELELTTVARPQPEEGQVLVRVRACAIARSDLELERGRRPTGWGPVILGHQFAGEVVESGGDRSSVWVGRRVVSYLHPGCGRCLPCRDRKTWLCELSAAHSLGMGQLDGALAEWLVLPEKALVEIPEGVDDEEAVFAHPLASALSALRWVEGTPPQRVLVIGDGNMGLLVTQVLHAAGHTVSVLGRHPSRRDLLWRSGISFSGVHEGSDGRMVSEAALATESHATVLECTGRDSGLELALQTIRPRGRIVLLSRHADDHGFDLRSAMEREIEIIGINGGQLEAALEYLMRKRIDILPLVAGKYPLKDAMTAFAVARTRGALKVILRNTGSDGGFGAR